MYSTIGRLYGYNEEDRQLFHPPISTRIIYRNIMKCEGFRQTSNTNGQVDTQLSQNTKII